MSITESKRTDASKEKTKQKTERSEDFLCFFLFFLYFCGRKDIHR